MRVIREEEFQERFIAILNEADLKSIGCVTGPGRSGAIAAVYASHHLRVPFIPYGCMPPEKIGRMLIVDTAMESGKTLKKACREYAAYDPVALFAFNEPPRVIFWYETPKPQRYRHEEFKKADGYGIMRF